METGQGKQSDISNNLKIEHLFPFIRPNIKEKREKMELSMNMCPYSVLSMQAAYQLVCGMYCEPLWDRVTDLMKGGI